MSSLIGLQWVDITTGAFPSEVNFLCRSNHGLSGVQTRPA
jgi:hypothetical protein